MAVGKEFGNKICPTERGGALFERRRSGEYGVSSGFPVPPPSTVDVFERSPLEDLPRSRERVARMSVRVEGRGHCPK